MDLTEKIAQEFNKHHHGLNHVSNKHVAEIINLYLEYSIIAHSG